MQHGRSCVVRLAIRDTPATNNDMTRTGPSDQPIRIGFVLIPGFPLMAYASAIEPLRAANQLSGRDLYAWWQASPDGRPVAGSNGISVLPDVDIDDPALSADRVFVCAGGNPSAFRDLHLFSWLRRQSRRGVAVGGISGGPYVLAHSGLLDGRRCTIHWEHAPSFQERFPTATVARSLFEIDGDRITCSGGIAALDLMLHLLAADYGTGLAAEVGDWFLHNQIRDGVAPHRMSVPERFGVRDSRLVQVLEAIETHLERPLCREALAGIAGLSLRQLERLFRDGMGTTLHLHYLQQRLHRAETLGREAGLSGAEIASASGFSSVGELRRAQRRYSPQTRSH